MYSIAIVELIACWLAWVAGFILRGKTAPHRKPVVVDPAARWGIVLQAISFSLIWSFVGPPAEQPGAIPRTIASMILAPVAVALSWSAVRHLGKQWRLDAGLNEDHELVRTGPYRLVRHPIYAGLFGLLLATGLLLTRWPALLAGIALFAAGTEIRIRVEERLLASRFRESFQEYRAAVPAYIPILR